MWGAHLLLLWSSGGTPPPPPPPVVIAGGGRLRRRKPHIDITLGPDQLPVWPDKTDPTQPHAPPVVRARRAILKAQARAHPFSDEEMTMLLSMLAAMEDA